MPATVTWTSSDLVALDASFTGISTGTFNYWAAIAAAQIADNDAFGNLTTHAGALLTAHFLSATGAYASTGAAPVQSESVMGGQGISVTYAMGTFSATELHLSRFGIQYERLVNMFGRGGILA